jgi:hypothetical protein
MMKMDDPRSSNDRSKGMMNAMMMMCAVLSIGRTCGTNRRRDGSLTVMMMGESEHLTLLGAKDAKRCDRQRHQKEERKD